jgi:predicted porin
LGFQIGFGHFAVGASGAYYKDYAHAGYAATTAASNDDGWAVTGGASYTIDAWSFGLQGLYGSCAQSTSAVLGTSAPGVSADRENMWSVSLNGAYALGPGISLEGQVAYTQASYGNLSAFGVWVPVPAIGAAVDATMVTRSSSIWVLRSTSNRRFSTTTTRGAVRRSPFI